MFFRPVRGSLSEAMSEQVEIFQSELLKHINYTYQFPFSEVVELKSEYQCFDSRINQQSYMVLGKFKKRERGEQEWMPVGYSNEPIR